MITIIYVPYVLLRNFDNKWCTISIRSFLSHLFCLGPAACNHEISLDFNSLVPGRCGSNFKDITFKLVIQNCSLCTRCEVALRWMPQNLTNEKSTLVQLMVCSPHGVTRTRWVNRPYVCAGVTLRSNMNEAVTKTTDRIQTKCPITPLAATISQHTYLKLLSYCRRQVNQSPRG